MLENHQCHPVVDSKPEQIVKLFLRVRYPAFTNMYTAINPGFSSVYLWYTTRPPVICKAPAQGEAGEGVSSSASVSSCDKVGGKFIRTLRGVGGEGRRGP